MPKSSAQSFPDNDALFWKIAAELIGTRGVAEGTMFGYRCLRVQGAFLAWIYDENGSLVVKLNKARTRELIDSGIAAPFTPAGRTFKEWVSVSIVDEDLWRDLLDEAIVIAEERK